MLKQASHEKLDVKGVVADITDYELTDVYDAVLMDRVLHMLESDKHTDSST